MYQIIMWDIDGTLLDFLAAEKAAIKRLFAEFELGECSDEMIERYSVINRSYWERLERGELTKPEVLVGRYIEFFTKEGLDVGKAAAFNDAYQLALGDTIVYCDDSKKIVESLKGKVIQAAASNGTIIAQTKKLKASGFGQLLDYIFLSEELGYEKPAREFFDIAFAEMGKEMKIEKDKILIVGDSLTSDIRGGNQAGIKTCWYNPHREQKKVDVQVDYEIKDLHEIFRILEE